MKYLSIHPVEISWVENVRANGTTHISHVIFRMNSFLEFALAEWSRKLEFCRINVVIHRRETLVSVICARTNYIFRSSPMTSQCGSAMYVRLFISLSLDSFRIIW